MRSMLENKKSRQSAGDGVLIPGGLFGGLRRWGADNSTEGGDAIECDLVSC